MEVQATMQCHPLVCGGVCDTTIATAQEREFVVLGPSQIKQLTPSAKDLFVMHGLKSSLSLMSQLMLCII